MKVEKTIKFTLDNEDQRAVNAVLDIVIEIFDKMTSEDSFAVCGEQYDRECIANVRDFLTDLWQNGDCACAIVED